MTHQAAVTGRENVAVLSERKRISEIMESPEGIARPKAAVELALRSSMDSKSAIAFLRTVPVDNPYVAAMEREGQIGLTGATGAPGGAVMEDAKAKRKAEISGAMKVFNEARGYSGAKAN